MEKINDYNDEYIDSKVMLKVLEDNYEKDISEIKREIATADLLLTEDKVKDFLDKRFQKDDKELYDWYQSEKKNPVVNVMEISAEEAANGFINRMKASKYSYNCHTLEHYNRFISVLKEKSFLLINLIDKISSNSVGDNEEKLIDKLDIDTIDGRIKKTDVERLLKPAIYNYNWLRKIVKEGNDLETYLYVKIDPAHDAMYPKIPDRDLQKSTAFYDINGCDGYVELTEKQKKKEEERFEEGAKELAKMINSIW